MSVQIAANIEKNIKRWRFLFKTTENIDEMRDENSLKILGRRGAKECTSKKHVNLIDLVESFPTTIWLHKSASIQPRTSP